MSNYYIADGKYKGVHIGKRVKLSLHRCEFYISTDFLSRFSIKEAGSILSGKHAHPISRCLVMDDKKKILIDTAYDLDIKVNLGYFFHEISKCEFMVVSGEFS